MGFQKRWGRIQDLYREYPSQFWVLVLGTFVDRLGGALLFPFFTLYITKKFGVGMTQVGVIFGLFSLSSVVGSFFGGALTDRLGRKSMLLFGLVVSALSSLMMAYVDSIEWFSVMALLVGLLSNTGGPAQQAMVADLLPEEKRTEGFGMIRVVVNLAVTIGPMIGGFLAAQSYLLLFYSDAITSLITAAIVYRAIRETRPERDETVPTESMVQTFKGYGDVFRNGAFAWFLGASAIMALVYMQMNTTLAVFLRDVHGITEQGFGAILSLNAGMVVLFQFPVTRWVNKFRPVMVMAAGTLLYAIGFSLYGFVSSYILFMGAMVIITIGEMFVSPVGQSTASRMAPSDKRGRYLAVYGFSWIVPSTFGPLLAGLVMDNLDPRWVWYGSGIFGLISAASFVLLQRRVGRSKWSLVDQRLEVLQLLEEKKITAHEAAMRMETIEPGSWAGLGEVNLTGEQRAVRFRLIETGMIKGDLRIPLALVHAALRAGSRLGEGLDGVDTEKLHRLLSDEESNGWTTTLLTGPDEQVQISVE